MSVKVYIKMAHPFWCANEACAGRRGSSNPRTREQDNTIYWNKHLARSQETRVRSLTPSLPGWSSASLGVDFLTYEYVEWTKVSFQLQVHRWLPFQTWYFFLHSLFLFWRKLSKVFPPHGCYRKSLSSGIRIKRKCFVHFVFTCSGRVSAPHVNMLAHYRRTACVAPPYRWHLSYELYRAL